MIGVSNVSKPFFFCWDQNSSLHIEIYTRGISQHVYRETFSFLSCTLCLPFWFLLNCCHPGFDHFSVFFLRKMGRKGSLHSRNKQPIVHQNLKKHTVSAKANSICANLSLCINSRTLSMDVYIAQACKKDLP